MQRFATLQISHRSGSIEYDLQIPEGEEAVRRYVATQPMNDVDLAELLTRASNLLRCSQSDGFEREAKLIGEALRKALLPHELAETLNSIDVPLLVSMDRPGFPFELMYAEGFWALRFAVGRLVSSRPSPHRRRERPDLRALIIGSDPKSDLEFVEKEAEIVLCGLREEGVNAVHVVAGREATVDIVRKRLAEGYDIIHFCGHVAPGGLDARASPGLLLAGGRILSGREIRADLDGCPFVFLNGCASAHDSVAGSWQRDITSLADNFMGGGASAVVATASDVSDEHAAEVAVEFYRRALAGQTLGEALRCARVHARDKARGSSAWLSFFLYGNPADVLIGSSAKVSYRVKRKYGELNTLGGPSKIDVQYQPPRLLRSLTPGESPKHLRRNIFGLPDHQTGTIDPHRCDILRWEESAFPKSRRRIGGRYDLEEVLGGFLRVTNGDSPIPRFIALGAPGSANTSIFQYLSGKAAGVKLGAWREGCLVRAGRRLVPVVVHLPAWQAWAAPATQRPNFSLAAYLESNEGSSIDAKQWAEWLDRGDVLLMFDALDELGAQSKAAFIEHALNTALRNYARCPTLVTCRSVSFGEYERLLPALPVFMLAPLEEKRDAYIQAYFAESPTRSAGLIRQLNALPQLEPLAANPLLLDIICSFVRKDPDAPLPQTPSEIYDKVINQRLGSGVEAYQKRRTLEEVALNLFVKDRRGTCSVAEFFEELKSTLVATGQGKDLTRALYDALAGKSGLLRGGEENVAFLHLTIQEFLAAAALARRANRDGWNARITSAAGKQQRLRDFVDDCAKHHRWRKVIAFLAGQLEQPGPLLRRLLDPRRESLTLDHLMLAALCVPEITPERRIALRAPIEQIATGLLEVGLVECGVSWAMVEAISAFAIVNPAISPAGYAGQLYRFARFVRGEKDPPVQWTFADCLVVSLFDDVALAAFGVARVIRALGSAAGVLLRQCPFGSQTRLLDYLLGLLREDRWDVRLAACEALAGLGGAVVEDPAFLRHLADLLNDPAWHVRAFAATAIGQMSAAAAKHAALASPEPRQRFPLAMLAEHLHDPHVGARPAQLCDPDLVATAGKSVEESFGGSVPDRESGTLMDENTKANVPGSLSRHRGEWYINPPVMFKRLGLMGFAQGGVQSAALAALHSLGRVSACDKTLIDQLAELLRDPTPVVPQLADGKPLVLASIQIEPDPHHSVRAAAALAVGALGAGAAGHSTLLQELSSLLDEGPEESDRLAAMSAIGALATAAATDRALLAALGSLKLNERVAGLLQAAEATVRITAALLVGALAGFQEFASLLDDLADLLSDERDVSVRHAVASAIGDLGLSAALHARLVPELRSLLHDPEVAVRAAAVSAAGRLATACSAQDVSLIEPVADLCEEAVRIMPAAPPSSPPEPPRHPDLDPANGAWAARTVAQSEWSRILRPSPIESGEAAEPSVEEAAMFAIQGLGALATQHQSVRDKLAAMLHSPEATFRAAAALAVGEVDPKIALDAGLVDVLARLLNDEEESVRSAIVAAVAKLGAAVAQHQLTLTGLGKLLSRGKETERVAVAYAVGQMGAVAAEDITIRNGVLALVKGAESTRAMAAWILGKIGGSAKEYQPWLKPPLETLQRDPRPSVRSAVATAIGELGAQAKLYPSLLRRLRQQLRDQQLGLEPAMAAYKLRDAGVWIPARRFPWWPPWLRMP